MRIQIIIMLLFHCDMGSFVSDYCLYRKHSPGKRCVGLCTHLRDLIAYNPLELLSHGYYDTGIVTCFLSLSPQCLSVDLIS